MGELLTTQGLGTALRTGIKWEETRTLHRFARLYSVPTVEKITPKWYFKIGMWLKDKGWPDSLVNIYCVDRNICVCSPVLKQGNELIKSIFGNNVKWRQIQFWLIVMYDLYIAKDYLNVCRNFWKIFTRGDDWYFVLGSFNDAQPTSQIRRLLILV